MIRNRIKRRLPNGIRIGYGTVYLFTEDSPRIIEQIANWEHIDRWHDAGIIAFFGMMVTGLIVLTFTAWTTLQRRPEPTAANDPSNLVAVPGVNEFLPLSAAVYIVLALIVAAAVHELAHGIAMRAEGITLTEIGIGCLVVLPIAAYVLPDEDEFDASSTRSRARILAAGVFANSLIFVLTSLLFVLPGTGNPIEAFLVYFGAIFGFGAPTPTAIATLGPITNTLFWLWFFNLNLAFLNALPIVYLDGGRIAAIAAAYVDLQGVQERWVSRGVVGVGTTSTLLLFGIAVFGPLLLQG